MLPQQKIRQQPDRNSKNPPNRRLQKPAVFLRGIFPIFAFNAYLLCGVAARSAARNAVAVRRQRWTTPQYDTAPRGLAHDICMHIGLHVKSTTAGRERPCASGRHQSGRAFGAAARAATLTFRARARMLDLPCLHAWRSQATAPCGLVGAPFCERPPQKPAIR